MRRQEWRPRRPFPVAQQGGRPLRSELCCRSTQPGVFKLSTGSAGPLLPPCRGFIPSESHTSYILTIALQTNSQLRSTDRNFVGMMLRTARFPCTRLVNACHPRNPCAAVIWSSLWEADPLYSGASIGRLWCRKFDTMTSRRNQKGKSRTTTYTSQSLGRADVATEYYMK